MNFIDKRLVFLSATVILLTVVSCDKTAKYEKEEREKIDNYLSEHPEQVFVEKPSGLYYFEVLPGNGVYLKTSDTAYVKYTGKFLNGYTFDTNVSNTGVIDTLIYPVNEDQMILGFEEGVSYMEEGGKSLLLVPSALAYGAYGYATIPGYAPLLFEIQLLKVGIGPNH